MGKKLLMVKQYLNARWITFRIRKNGTVQMYRRDKKKIPSQFSPPFTIIINKHLLSTAVVVDGKRRQEEDYTDLERHSP